jgi:TIR domain
VVCAVVDKEMHRHRGSIADAMPEPTEYNVFLSWAGERSRSVAETFGRVLRWAMSAARPWISTRDVSPGAIWFEEIRQRLNLKFGVTFMTPEEQDSRWLNFEAGGIFKALQNDKSRLYPVLIGFQGPLDSRHPLSNLQTVSADKIGFQRVFRDLAQGLGDSRAASDLDTVYEKLWPDLDTCLKALPAAASPIGKVVDPADALAEIIQAIRVLKTDRASDVGGEIRQALSQIQGQLQSIFSARWPDPLTGILMSPLGPIGPAHGYGPGGSGGTGGTGGSLGPIGPAHGYGPSGPSGPPMSAADWTNATAALGATGATGSLGAGLPGPGGPQGATGPSVPVVGSLGGVQGERGPKGPTRPSGP